MLIRQGLNPLPTFDWTYINAAGLSPLITPWWATLSIFSKPQQPSHTIVTEFRC